MRDETDLSSLDEAEFRRRFRSWLDETYPPEWRQPMILRLQGDDEKRWMRMLFDGGWRLPSWPREYGGMGLNLQLQLAYAEVLDQFGAARILDSGGHLLGPALIKYGTQAQKDEHLLAIARGDVLWCQGYSEPNAGSDLAGVRMTAVRDGDDYIVNGSKIWTTMAPYSQKIYLLVRTSKEARKQQGISFLLADMDAPGISVRPIENLAGDTEFAQVFFDNVRVPARNLVHKEGEGWTVAKSLLGDERIFSGSPNLSRHAMMYFERVVAGRDLSDDLLVSKLHADLAADLHDLTALYGQVVNAVIEGIAEAKEFATLKLIATNLFQRIADGALEISGEAGTSWDATAFGNDAVEVRRISMLSRPATIYAGANEVQKDIIARALLGKATA